MYFVYILECKDRSLYTGITTDLKRRFKEHQDGTGGHYTRAKGVRKIVYNEKQPNRSAASVREAKIKRLSRSQKLKIIYAKKKK